METYTLTTSNFEYYFYPNSIEYSSFDGDVMHESVSESDYLTLRDARDNPPENHVIKINRDLTFEYVYIEPEFDPQAEAESRQLEMEQELTWAMIQREYHLTNDVKRMRVDRTLLDNYSIACRDHVQRINGVLVIVGEKPVRPEQGAPFINPL